jgi:uncharacterized protein YggE
MKKLLILLFSALFISSCTDNSKKPSIALQVNQKVKIPVRYVSVHAGVQLNDQKAAAAEKNGYQKAATVEAVLKKMGYKKDQLEIKSGEVSYQRYKKQGPYRFDASIDFDITNLDKIDAIRRALINAGATSFNITGFKNANEDSLYDAAYQQAIDKPREKAQQLVKNQKVKIGRILNINEGMRRIYNISAGLATQPRHHLMVTGYGAKKQVKPLFHKKYYTKNIRFSIQFALKKR